MKKNVLIFGLIALLQLSLMSCSDNDANDDTTTIDDSSNALYTEVLTDVSLDVITKTYGDLFNNASQLNVEAQNLTIGDETALQNLKNAWKSTRAPWEKTEGFLYGPVDTEGIDPSIDSWPVDVNAINNVLDSGNEITPALLESNNEARGFHTIEYFIWGLNGDKPASQLTEREIEYLMAATQDLKNKTEQLYNGWLVTGNNFASNFINAGSNSSIYTSQKAALEEMAEGMAAIADEVANGKIETPLNGNGGNAMPEAEESRFSNNSKLDFANNIRSIQNVYLGDYSGVEGKGLSDIVVEGNITLDVEIKTSISEAISSIEAIPGTFTDAIVNNRTQVENAQNKVADLLAVLQSQLLPYISNL